ncbi:MAG: SH3 domain-containing protein [Peptostreptococcaceae bacterium]
MSLNKNKVIASVIATSIVAPMAYNISYADEINIDVTGENDTNVVNENEVEYVDEKDIQVEEESNVQAIDQNDIQVADVEYRTITGNGVNFRKGPGTNYSSITKLNKGYTVEYIGTSGNWINVKYNGTIGYVHSDYVSNSNNTSTPDNGDSTVKSTKVVTGNSVNFRTGPSTSNSSIGKLSKGSEVGFISESNGWSKISYNGKVGYMSSQYLADKTENPSTPDNGDNTVKSTKVVTGNSVNFRTGPSTSNSSMGKLSKGSEVGFISESNGWSKISYNGKVGYMSSQYLADKTENPSTPDDDNSVKSTKVVTGNNVNFRTGPSTSNSSMGKLSMGTEVGFISESNGWSKISYNGKVGYMSSQYLADKGSSDVSASEKAEKVLSYAKTLLGKPYVWGAEGPNSFDCSGYTQYVLKKSVGVSIPRVSRDQSKYGQSVSRSNLQPGDLVFFDTDGSNNGYVSHCGIYMGNGEFIHASSSGGKVIISNMSSGYYSNAYVNARRVL